MTGVVSMDTMLLRCFQRQVLHQCDFMLLAAADMNAALQGHDMTRVFYGVQNFLNAAANIAKALWGQAGRLAAQRADLRASLGVTDDSPLRVVTMRNNFEHIDERLETWWRDSERHIMIDWCVGPKAAVGGLEPIDWFRGFDPVTTDLYFWSQEFNLQALLTEVQRMLPTLRAAASTPHWVTAPQSAAE